MRSFTKPQLLLLSVAIAAALTGCNKQDETAVVPTTPDTQTAAADSARLSLDEDSLPELAAFEIDDLDPAIDACNDFGGYVNDRWLAAHDIPGDRTSWGAFEMIDERSRAVQQQLVEQVAAHEDPSSVEKLVGDFWATGMDAEKVNAAGLAPLQSRLNAIDALEDSDDIAAWLRNASANGENFVFGFGANADFADSSMNIAYAMQGGLGLPDKTYYIDADKADKLAAYQQHVANTLALAGAEPEQAAQAARQVVDFESQLADASRSREEMSRDVSIFYNPVSMTAANELTPSFSWSRFFAAVEVEQPKMFSLAMPEFHEKLNELMTTAPVDQWRAYLRMHTLDNAAPYLSDAFAQEHFKFHSQEMRGQSEMKSRAKLVIDTINGNIGEALGQLYVDVAFSPEAKSRMEELVANLSAAVRTRIENLEWMSDETKKEAIAKWATFTPKIGYPDKWRDWTGLQTERDSYIGNVLAASSFNNRFDLDKIGQPVDPTEWAMNPQTVNAYYNPQQNEIVFPAAILQPPFFDLKADDALNYGGIGAVIGHEIIHGYDDQGSRFNAAGNHVNWWTEEDSKAFGELTAKLVEQFNSYEATPGKFVNGRLTLGENIADLGGLAVALDALRSAVDEQPDPMIDGLAREQRFFVNWATVWRRNFTPQELQVRLATDPHAPANFRAIGAPSNMPAFAEAFDCKTGSPMVRAESERVTIW